MATPEQYAALFDAIRLAGVPITALNDDFTVEPSQLQTQAQPVIDAYNLGDVDEFWRTHWHGVAKAFLTSNDPWAKAMKAMLIVTLDEFGRHADKINANAAKLNQVLTAMRTATSLANLQSLVSAANIPNLTDYPERTLADLRNAMSAEIDAGNADN